MHVDSSCGQHLARGKMAQCTADKLEIKRRSTAGKVLCLRVFAGRNAEQGRTMNTWRPRNQGIHAGSLARPGIKSIVTGSCDTSSLVSSRAAYPLAALFFARLHVKSR